MEPEFERDNEYIRYYKQVNAKRKSQYLMIEEIKFYVNSNVFSPDPSITYSTQFTINRLKRIILKNKNVIELGCGSGIISLFCAMCGANVTATDIDDKCIKNIKRNINEHNLKNKINVIKSNVFDNIDKNIKFDIIVNHLPICNEVWNVDVNDIACKFFEDLDKYVHKDTKILVVFGSFEDVNIIKKRLSHSKYKWNEIAEKHFKNITWYMYENFV